MKKKSTIPEKRCLERVFDWCVSRVPHSLTSRPCGGATIGAAHAQTPQVNLVSALAQKPDSQLVL